jgi:hypothetical protein
MARAEPHCDYPAVGVVLRDGGRDAPAARAQVADRLGAGPRPQEFDGSLGEQFCFGAGNHAVGRDVELERIEFCSARQVCHRLMFRRSFD